MHAWSGTLCSLVPAYPARFALPHSIDEQQHAWATNGPRLAEESTARLSLAIEAAARALIDAESSLNALDDKVGDGDCGTTLRRGADRILQDLPSYPLHSIALTFRALQQSVASSMGGTSGALYQILFITMYRELKDRPQISLKELSDAFSAAVQSVSTYGGAQENYRTMLDALLPAAYQLRMAASQDIEPNTAFAKAALEAQRGAERTKAMPALAGRSNYVPDELLKHVPDPGALAVATWMLSASKSTQGKK